MNYPGALKAIVAALEQNLRLLEGYVRVSSAIHVGAIVRRRRRALSTLRAALRQRGIPMPVAGPGGPRAALAPSLNDLRQDEFRLLELYDAGIGLISENAAEARLLAEQRAESEQAYLTFAASLRDAGPTPPHSATPFHW